MKTIVKALKAIYVAFGGQASAVAGLKTTSEVLDALKNVVTCGNLPTAGVEDNGKILKVIEGAWAKGSPELPAVTADDNGKFLKVVDGGWTKANVTDKLFVVTYTETSDVWTCDKTVAQIQSAIANGYAVVSYALRTGGAVQMFEISRIATVETTTTITLSNVIKSGTNLVYTEIAHVNNGIESITENVTNIPLG